MITSAAIMAALIGPKLNLPYHPVYILLSIGFGSLFISWMNDSGFWVVTRMSGFTEKEGLQTWTVLLAVIARGWTSPGNVVVMDITSGLVLYSVQAFANFI
jgi:GntP family gluconate:H+ symporter